MKTFNAAQIEIPSYYRTEADKALYIATKEAYHVYSTLNTEFDRESFVTMWTEKEVAACKEETRRDLEDMPVLWSSMTTIGAVACAG